MGTGCQGNLEDIPVPPTSHVLQTCAQWETMANTGKWQVTFQKKPPNRQNPEDFPDFLTKVVFLSSSHTTLSYLSLFLPFCLYCYRRICPISCYSFDSTGLRLEAEGCLSVWNEGPGSRKGWVCPLCDSVVAKLFMLVKLKTSKTSLDSSKKL